MRRVCVCVCERERERGKVGRKGKGGGVILKSCFKKRRGRGC